MNSWTLIRRSLRFHARGHLGVVLGAAIGSAALIGALVVGDSVRESLTDMALRRLGSIHFALDAQDRLFQASLGFMGGNERTDSHRAGVHLGSFPLRPRRMRCCSFQVSFPGRMERRAPTL